VPLVKAVQEQQLEIGNLKTENSALKLSNEEMKAENIAFEKRLRLLESKIDTK